MVEMAKKLFRLDILIIILIVLSIISMFVGVIPLSINEIFSLSEQQKNILASSRFPRTISIIIAGASLAVSGLIMQQLTRNKFVSPTTAGTMDWTQRGILIGIVSFPRSEEHTSELQSRGHIVCRLLLEKTNKIMT